jgi:hypothetical protein
MLAMLKSLCEVNTILNIAALSKEDIIKKMVEEGTEIDEKIAELQTNISYNLDKAKNSDITDTRLDLFKLPKNILSEPVRVMNEGDLSQISGCDDIMSKCKELLGCRTTVNLNKVTYINYLMYINSQLAGLRDEIFLYKNIFVKYVDENITNDSSTNDLASTVLNKFMSIMKLYRAKVLSLGVCLEKCNARIFNNTSINESVDISDENLMTYITELDKLIEEIREFYDKFEHKDFLVPRKKRLSKMKEYMCGALQRKYTLKIPIYKVVNKSHKVKDTIENTFIRNLTKIK